jgi:hypothetical protein
VFDGAPGLEMAPLLIDSLVTGTRTFCTDVPFLLDTDFARADTANPDSGDVHFPNAPPSRGFTAPLELDETKPGSQLKTDAKFQLRAALRRGTCMMAGAINQPDGRAFAFYVVYS